MKLGIPTLCRYDLLLRLVRSAEAGSLRPSGYIIVDNGGGLPEGELRALLGARFLEIVRPDKNIGVAASWNLIIDRAAPEDVIISNDDIVLGKDTFREMASALEDSLFVEGDGWALFGQQHQLVHLVGYYDENFWPAYYEDVDYDLRLARAGIRPFRPVLSEPVHHEGWATTTSLGSPEWLRLGRERNHAYFISKWGGESKNPRWNGNDAIVHYAEPFNGNPPDGWNERNRMSGSTAMRWDVLNQVAKVNGAARYLEIGVNNGECLERVEVAERWGVDPAANGAGVRAPDVVIPRSSQFFFEKIAPRLHLTFDLIFIDGDHRAEVVYGEIMAAKEYLSPRGIICVHDCNPHSEEMQEVPLRSGGLWTGDVWKTIARIRNEAEFDCRVVPSDYGTAILVPATTRAIRQMALPCAWDRLLWKDLVADRERLLGLLHPVHWTEWVRQLADRAL